MTLPDDAPPYPPGYGQPFAPRPPFLGGPFAWYAGAKAKREIDALVVFGIVSAPDNYGENTY